MRTRGKSAGRCSGDLAEAAQVLSELGLATAYGHVSARASMLVTPAADLATVAESAIVAVPLDASVWPARVPAEAWAHLALYQARPDAMSVARAQPPSAFAAAAAGIALAPLYGQAAWPGATIPVHGGAQPLRSADLAGRAARDLPAGEAPLLRGNGALTIGPAPGLAVTRMWLLSAACAAWLAARAAGQVKALTAEESASWRAVSGELLPRLWEHLRRRGHRESSALR